MFQCLCLILVLVLCSPLCKAAAYLYISKTGNYDEGRLLCNQFGLDLAKVSSEQDIDDLHAIYSNLPEFSDVAWLGLHYEDPDFLWPDGTLVQYSRWNNVEDDEPDFLDFSKCAVVKRSYLLWHTRSCSEEHPVLCGPYVNSDTPKSRNIIFTRWRAGEEFTANPTAVEQGVSAPACLQGCLLLGNCMFFAMIDSTCMMYSDIPSVSTNNKNMTVIWKKNTITLN